jgi:hypothetical protein
LTAQQLKCEQTRAAWPRFACIRRESRRIISTVDRTWLIRAPGDGYDSLDGGLGDDLIEALAEVEAAVCGSFGVDLEACGRRGGTATRRGWWRCIGRANAVQYRFETVAPIAARMRVSGGPKRLLPWRSKIYTASFRSHISARG